MEKIVKRLFITVALLTAVAASSLSLTTYAADYTCSGANCQTLPNGTTNEFNKTSVFSLTVGTMVQLSNVGSVSITADNTLKTSNFSATVTTNNKSYAIQLSATQPNLVHSTSSTTTIPAKDAVAAGASGWAIQNKNNSNAYRGLTTTAYTYFKSTSAAPSGTATTFTVGVGVAPTQAAGTYSTTMTVTAVAPAP